MNFWDHHGALFLFSAVFFPRLTILFGTGLTPLFDILGWVGWLLLPRFMIAYYATLTYGEANPVLCGLAWIVAVLGLLGGGGEAARRSA